MLRSSKFLAIVVTLLLIATGICLAQTETGQIGGTVKDASDAVVANAKVTAKSVNTGLTREATTNSAGLYTIPSLKPDTYEVSIEATGFKKFARRVQVTVGSQNDVSAQLIIGTTATTVEVSALGETVAVNTENQTMSAIITTSDLDKLPTSPTRNPYTLVASASNVNADNADGRGAGFSINGQRSASTSILLDGAENVDAFTAGIGQQIPLDSVQEFSVLTSNFGAEYGRASGGVVNLVTKSGTNQFHGSAYEFNRISALSSNTFQNNATGTPKGVFTRNNFGFSVGGPVKKDKLFFFDNLEWLRVRSNAPQQLGIIDPASVATLTGPGADFFAQYGANLGPYSLIDSVPNCGGTTLTCDQISYVVPSDAGGGTPQNTWQNVGRVDFNLSTKTTITGRYAAYHEVDFVGTVSSSPYAGYNTGANAFDQNITLAVSHVFSTNLVDTAKVVYNRLNGPVQPLGSNPVGPTLFTSSSLPNIDADHAVPLAFPGYLETSPGNSIPFGGPQNLYQFYNDLSYSHGKHQFKAGGQFIHIRDNRVFGAYETAVEYLGPNTVAAGLTNLISGNIYQFQSAIYPQGEFPCYRDPATGAYIQTPACTLTLPVGPPNFERNFHYNDLAFYGQDSWKVTNHFTLNYGLRWEYYGVQHNANTDYDSNFVMGPGATPFDRVRNGQVELAKNGGVFWKPSYAGFGPRIGFAWDVFGNGKTSIRGGYSIAYERNFGNVTFNAIQNPPNYGVISLIAGQDIPSMPVYTDNAGPLAGTGITKLFPAVSQRAINQNMKMAYAETWNLSVERQVTRNSLVSVAYAGSHGIHGYDISNINLAGEGGEYLGDARFGNRLNLQYSNMNYRSDNGYSHYNSLGLAWRANNLWSKGVNLSASYTWSHTLDNLSSTFSDTNGGTASGLYALGYLDSFNPQLNYGNADYDIRHRFRLDGSWELPWLKTGGNPVSRAVLGGWGVGANFELRSGMPFSIFDGTNFNGQDYPLWIAPTAVSHKGTVSGSGQGNSFGYITLPTMLDGEDGLCAGAPECVQNWGDSLGLPNCTGLYHTGCTYTLSGLPYPRRNQYYGPKYSQLNMNFFKNFKVTERFGLQFRAEMYNLPNHSNAYVQTTNIDVEPYAATSILAEKGGPYGYAGTSADERRNIQLGLRLTF
ncbi:MAG TPA: carboxypeptidase regulatory-like domain-containing protein [Terriglobales bacterium]|nr:carboxypeptidase regulatory-like domain-containing protein [Terriglobales bacterium]